MRLNYHLIFTRERDTKHNPQTSFIIFLALLSSIYPENQQIDQHKILIHDREILLLKKA